MSASALTFCSLTGMTRCVRQNTPEALAIGCTPCTTRPPPQADVRHNRVSVVCCRHWQMRSTSQGAANPAWRGCNRHCSLQHLCLSRMHCSSGVSSLSRVSVAVSCGLYWRASFPAHSPFTAFHGGSDLLIEGYSKKVTFCEVLIALNGWSMAGHHS